MERVTLGAMAVAPVRGRVVAVEVGVAVAVILFAEPDDHPVADLGGDPAVMRVVGSANPGKLPVVSVLVAIQLLPIPVGIGRQGIHHIHSRLRLQKPQGEQLRGTKARSGQTAPLQEGTAGKGVVQVTAHG